MPGPLPPTRREVLASLRRRKREGRRRKLSDLMSGVGAAADRGVAIATGGPGAQAQPESPGARQAMIRQQLMSNPQIGPQIQQQRRAVESVAGPNPQQIQQMVAAGKMDPRLARMLLARSGGG